MDWNVLDEYLVRIGADIDRQSFDSALGVLNKLKQGLSKLKSAAAPLALAGAISAIGKAAYETVKGVAQADMEYQKLAASMWVTKETAKALSVAMKTMGVSQEDLAWVPELREQFFRLREEINKFATPQDADAQLRYIREIGYDVQTLFVRLKMLKEWIAYYLIKYLEPYIKDFKAFVNWLLDKLGEDLPGLARKVARAMSAVLGPVLATLKLIGMAIGKVYDFIVELPENVKKWAAIFAAVGAAIMAGPFGMIIAGLTMAMLLLEDFLGYMNGWDSSSDLAPLWETLLAFQEGTGAEWLDDFKVKLGEIAEILDHVANELDLPGVLREIKAAVLELKDGLVALWKENQKEFSEFFKRLGIGLPQVKTFFGTIATGVAEAIKSVAYLAKLIGKVMQAMALAGEGKFSEAGGLFKDAVLEFGDAILESNKRFYGKAEKNLKEWYHNTTSERGGGGSFGGTKWDSIKEFFGFGGGDGSGDAVVENASRFDRGYQWMDPTGANTDPRNQCASFASQMMAGSGVGVDVTMNGDDLASQFKREGAYHRAGDGYEPQPGDLIDWAHHVGIYAGNGEYIARNSSGGVVRGSMQGMEEYFGSLWGFGSVSELQAAKNQDDGVSNQNDYALAEAVTGSQQDVPDVAGSAGFVEGSNEMAMSPFQNILKGWEKPQIQIPQIQIPQIQVPEMKIPDIQVAAAEAPEMPKIMMPEMPEMPEQTYAEDATRDNLQFLPQQAPVSSSTSYAMNMGAPVININVAGTNATPKEIAGAVKDGMTELGEYLMNIQARNMRRPVV